MKGGEGGKGGWVMASGGGRKVGLRLWVGGGGGGKKGEWGWVKWVDLEFLIMVVVPVWWRY